MIPLLPGGPEEALQLAAAHVLQNNEHGLALGATAQQPHHVGMWVQILHDPQLLREVQPLALGGVLLQGLHRHDRGAGLAVDVQGLALPHLAEAALAKDIKHLKKKNDQSFRQKEDSTVRSAGRSIDTNLVILFYI